MNSVEQIRKRIPFGHAEINGVRHTLYLATTDKFAAAPSRIAEAVKKATLQ